VSVTGDNVTAAVELPAATAAGMLLALLGPGEQTLDLETTREIQTGMTAREGETMSFEIVRGTIEKVMPAEQNHVTARFDETTLTLTVGAGAKAGDKAEFTIRVKGLGDTTTKLIVTLR
jgi:hypothetical protein